MIGAVTTSGSLGAQARRAADSSALEMVARAGYAVSGLLHLLIGGIAVRLATGSGGQSADQSGALAQVAAQPFGRVVLWIGVVGFAALGLSQLGEAVWGGGGGDRTDRTKQVGKTGGKAVVYLALSGSTLSFARGASSSSSKQSSDVTATLLQSSGGRVLVTAIGLVVVGVGGYHMVKGARKKFLADLAGNAGGDVGRAVVRIGQVGYLAKGVALIVVGVLFVVAAVQSDPSQARGLDGALTTLGRQPGGPVVLVLVGIGFVGYGLYSFARARYARM